MNWRDIAVGAAVTLTVSIMATVGGYYLTRENGPLEANPLIYTMKTSAAFEGNPNKTAFVSFDVQNRGPKPLHNVQATGEFGDDADIRERTVTISSGPAGKFTDSSTSHRIDVFLPALAPEERLSITFLIAGPERSEPVIGVRSDESVGVMEITQSDESEDLLKIGRSTAVLLIVAALVLQSILFFVVRRWMQGPSHLFSILFASQNDTAFVYLMQGLVDEAELILSRQLQRRGGYPIALANYALALGLKGNNAAATKLFEAAEWWAEIRHEKAVIAFDKAILLISSANTNEGKAELRRAISLSPKAVRRYCRLSVIIRDAAKADSQLAQIAGIDQ